MKLKILLLVSFVLASCKSTSEFTGFSYDPPGGTDTTGRKITEQKRRVIGAGSPKVWISNEFEGARAVDFYQVDENTFEVLIEPENYPINNSPWYAFSIWGEEERPITLQIAYKEGQHRYLPKIHRNIEGLSYSHIIQDAEFDSLTGTSKFRIYLETDSQTVSAHFLENIRFSDLEKTLSSLNEPFIFLDTVGTTHQNHPILELTVDETSVDGEKGILAIVSRQHPPEVAAYHAYLYFFDTLTSDSQLAREFRSYFIVKAYPMLNPDGVVNGHWRHNGAGVDLNRDWINFNQPETQAVRDALLSATSTNDNRVYYAVDFHSTNENIFYPILEEVETFPDNLTQRWFEIIDTSLPDLNFSSEEFDTSSPIAKNWFYRTFGSDAVTFEVYDELPLDEIRNLGVNSANSLMELLIDEWKKANP